MLVRRNFCGKKFSKISKMAAQKVFSLSVGSSNGHNFAGVNIAAAIFAGHGRGEWGCMKRKIVWGKVKHSYYFSAKTSLKFVSSKNKINVSFCPMFHTASFTPR
jgi:hypothetical protein